MAKQTLMHIFLSLFLLSLCACNFYQCQEGMVESKFKSAGLESKYLAIENTGIHYWKGGKGFPLLMLHGFGADSRFQWAEQVETFSSLYTLIIPDLIYFDGSTSSSNDFSIDFQAEMMTRLMDHLKIDRFFLLGVSYGGLVGITLTDKIPGRIGKLIICDSPVKFYSVQDSEEAWKAFGVNSAQDLFVPKRPEDLPRLLELAYYHPPWTPDFVLPDVYENMFKNQQEEKSRLLDYLKDENEYFRQKEYTVNCDVLLIWGRHDALIPLKTAEQLKSYLGSKTELVIIEDTAHMPGMERPEQFNKVVLDFLQ
ncbi:MAG: alpha/beta hydrolase [Spirochaetales bacterium]|nr:alpha/beta hydrolase [Spirochaetales bacterium]